MDKAIIKYVGNLIRIKWSFSDIYRNNPHCITYNEYYTVELPVKLSNAFISEKIPYDMWKKCHHNISVSKAKQRFDLNIGTNIQKTIISIDIRQ